jgi:S-adenosylmethionine:tRNA ribosyltransferase-isomerase
MRLEDFAYEIPPELIAQEPAAERTGSRLLVLDKSGKSFSDKTFADIYDFISSGDVLVLNDTKVIPARILAKRKSGGEVEFLLIKPEPTVPGRWEAMAAPLRKLKVGDELDVDIPGSTEKFKLHVAGFTTSSDEQRRVLIDFGGQAEVFALLNMIGQAPLPPYIVRQREISNNEQRIDNERYQTVYAQAPGAVAAPTAGLHFTRELLDKLSAKGVEIVYITLHVGPGTFKPITAELDKHTIESETFYISANSAATINRAKAAGHKVFAVGTTSCRALETAGKTGQVRVVDGEASNLYIYPGFEFQIVDSLITNFHLSKSSLLVLVSAFADRDLIMQAYQHAIEKRYRFYSYGDAMLIL